MSKVSFLQNLISLVVGPNPHIEQFQKDLDRLEKEFNDEAIRSNDRIVNLRILNEAMTSRYEKAKDDLLHEVEISKALAGELVKVRGNLKTAIHRLVGAQSRAMENALRVEKWKNIAYARFGDIPDRLEFLEERRADLRNRCKQLAGERDRVINAVRELIDRGEGHPITHEELVAALEKRNAK